MISVYDLGEGIAQHGDYHTVIHVIETEPFQFRNSWHLPQVVVDFGFVFEQFGRTVDGFHFNSDWVVGMDVDSSVDCPKVAFSQFLSNFIFVPHDFHFLFGVSLVSLKLQ